jgi:hypothetical protein
MNVKLPCIARSGLFQLIKEVQDDFIQGQFIFDNHTISTYIFLAVEGSSPFLYVYSKRLDRFFDFYQKCIFAKYLYLKSI